VAARDLDSTFAALRKPGSALNGHVRRLLRNELDSLEHALADFPVERKVATPVVLQGRSLVVDPAT
jgi:hypothetical protein